MFLCLSTVKFNSRLLLIILALLVITPLIGHYYLSKEEKDGFENSYNTHSKVEAYEDYGVLRATDLKHRIAELVRIKNSVNNELRNIEGKRQKLLSELSLNHKKIEDAKTELIRQEAELEKLKISVKQAQVAENEAVAQNSPRLAPPTVILPANPPSFIPLVKTHSYKCHNMKNCFDYSRCSLTSGFPFYFYHSEEFSELVSTSLNKIVFQVLRYNPHFTNSSDKACIYVALIGETHNSINTTQLNQLPFWGGDGRNHILFYLSKNMYNRPNFDQNINFGRAIIAQSFWDEKNFRLGHDILLPASFGPPGGDVWMDSPYMLPARRKYLLSFEGYKNVNSSKNQQSFVEMVQTFLTQTTIDQFYIKTDCKNNRIGSNVFDWCLCGNETKRKEFLTQSTFTLVPAPLDIDMISTAMMQARIYESLKFSAIPVFLEHDRIGLPFDEVIDWCRAAVCIVGERVPELHWLLRTIPDNDILMMRRQGRMLYEKYFGTVQSILDTTLALIRNRIGIPPLPVIDVPSPSIFSENFKPIKMDPIIPDAEPEESLGPLEPPFKSPDFKRNYTIMKVQGYELWNGWGDPFKLYPYTPFDPLLPSDAKFIGSGKGFRPVNNGAGGAGKEFCQSLGGNSPREQFTIVILTYERDQVLMNSLSRLNGLPYLNKVLVVWNSPKPPLEDLRWPEIGVPIHVIQAAKNSLNNRFLPYEAIETEAVLSVDDDAHLRHDEIMFGFRVWREQRDRVVGFPGRFHALDLNNGGWLYNSNYSCELSMVLTGAAFVHKYYLYLYSYWLPQAIRDKVDQYMNCEDIAMNFLVSHVTNKPPVKVTSRWTFRCPGCPVSLSEDETHFLERHKCINFFTQEGNISVNEHHKNVIKTYVEFMSHQKNQSIIVINKMFEEVFKTNLLDETFTKEEVKNILNNLEKVLTHEIKCELSAFTNTNLLMMYQFFQQAEKWHLRLNADISEMQNKELLLEMERIESNYDIMNQTLEKKKLLPITDHITNDFAEMLQKRLQQLESHNSKLKTDLKFLEDNYNQLSKENQTLKLQIEEQGNQISSQKNVVECEVQTQNIFYEKTNDHEECKITLNQLKNELIIVQSQLTLSNLELERKFNDTAAYNNMKNIITKKNEQVRSLRDRLLVYEKEDSEENV